MVVTSQILSGVSQCVFGAVNCQIEEDVIIRVKLNVLFLFAMDFFSVEKQRFFHPAVC